MTLVRRAIHDAVEAKLRATSLTVEALHEAGPQDLAFRSEPTAILQEGGDVVLSIDSGRIVRQASGAIHLADQDDGDAVAVRAAADAVSIIAEKALLELAVTMNETVPGVREFNLSEYAPRMIGEDGGSISARVTWTCSYSHQAQDPEVGA